MSLSSRRKGHARLWRRWGTKAARTSYRVKCACGKTLTGERSDTGQVLDCSQCGQPVYVLPQSAWPRVADVPIPPPSTRRSLRSMRASGRAWQTRKSRAWLLPVWAGAVAVAVAFVVILVASRFLFGLSRDDRLRDARSYVEQSIRAAQRGEFPVALGLLDDACNAFQPHSKEPGVAGELQGADRVRRQVRLLAALAPLTLEEILTTAEQQPMADWLGGGEAGHVGKAVVFDGLLTLGPPDKAAPEFDYRLLKHGTPAHLDFSGLPKLAEVLSAYQADRWVFALRIASLRMQVEPQFPQGRWVVRFQAQSLQWITEAPLLGFWSIPHDPGSSDVFGRQHGIPVRLRDGVLQEFRKPLPGDSAATVKRLLGPPERIARQIVAGKHRAQWVYPQRGNTRVTLEQRFGHVAAVVAPVVLPERPL
jgi:hypothetical protein